MLALATNRAWPGPIPWWLQRFRDARFEVRDRGGMQGVERDPTALPLLDENLCRRNQNAVEIEVAWPRANVSRDPLGKTGIDTVDHRREVDDKGSIGFRPPSAGPIDPLEKTLDHPGAGLSAIATRPTVAPASSRSGP